MIWRLTPKAVGRGDKRTLVDNVYWNPNWEFSFWATRNPGPGRYRVELRDAKRALAKVRYANQTPENQGNPPPYTVGRSRPPAKRKVPPPVAAWDSQTPNIEQRRQIAARRAMPTRTLQGRAQAPVSQPVPASRPPQQSPARGAPRPAVPAPPGYPGASQPFARQPLDSSGSAHQPNQRPPPGAPPPSPRRT